MNGCIYIACQTQIFALTVEVGRLLDSDVKFDVERRYHLCPFSFVMIGGDEQQPWSACYSRREFLTGLSLADWGSLVLNAVCPSLGGRLAPLTDPPRKDARQPTGDPDRGPDRTQSRPEELLDTAVDQTMMALLACMSVANSPAFERDPAWGLLGDARAGVERAHTLLMKFRMLPQIEARTEAQG